MSLIKDNGVVYTPKTIVRKILDFSGYYGEEILGKHVIDNASGEGAFLVEVVKRYANEYLKKHHGLKAREGLKKDLETFIHGIEIDPTSKERCVSNLNEVVSNYGISNVDFDVLNENTLNVTKYNGKMDFVIGNPPYVRIHNLKDNLFGIKKRKFSSFGMTDLFIAFYELGLEMLNEKGVLSYITPSSVFTSVAAKAFRSHIIKGKLLTGVINLEHFKVFDKISTYTCILKLQKQNKEGEIDYYEYDSSTSDHRFIDVLPYKLFYIKENFYFGQKDALKDFIKIARIDTVDSEIEVKNGFATLADSVFISDDFGFESRFIRPVLKGSKGKWRKMIFPYDENLNIVNFEDFEENLKKYLLSHKEKLLARATDKNTPWYGFGRSQGVKDFYKHKISINTTVKKKEDLKIIRVKEGEGVYSGLYIISKYKIDEIKKHLLSYDFLNYIKAIGKYKSGGYYTFSTSDLKKYLIHETKSVIGIDTF